MDGSSSLLEVHELLALLPHYASGNVVGAEGIAELGPRYLVVRGASGDVVGPPRAGIATQLLRGEESLLQLGAAQEPKHGLHHPKSVVSFEGFSNLGEERSVSSHKFTIGCRSGSISCPIATLSGVGHELPHQLGLLVTGLEDRSDRLSQARRWRRVSVLLGALGPSSSVVGVHHLLSNMLPLA
jgi:hypothetical protein